MQEKNNNNHQQNNRKFEGIPFLEIVIIVVGFLLLLLRTFMMGSGYFIDYIFQVLGGLIATIFFAFIVGIVPYFILKRYFKKAKLVVFSLSFLLINIITLISFLYREWK